MRRHKLKARASTRVRLYRIRAFEEEYDVGTFSDLFGSTIDEAVATGSAAAGKSTGESNGG
jgi:hypothetical protein